MIGADQYRPILAWSDRIGIGKIADKTLPITRDEVCEEINVYGYRWKAVNEVNCQLVIIQFYSLVGFYLLHLFIASIAIISINCCMGKRRRGSYWGHDITSCQNKKELSDGIRNNDTSPGRATSGQRVDNNYLSDAIIRLYLSSFII